jgi:Uma2 family endonuclease
LRKRLIYQGHSVPRYWIVDLDARVIERWRPSDDRPEMVGGRLTWGPRPDMPAIDIDLRSLFDTVVR